MGVGSCTSKTFLILISLLFLAAAAALAYVGINAIVTYKQYENVVGNMYVMLPAVIILGVAVFMLIIGCLGFCSTIQESCCGLGCFITLISIILVAGVASLVLGLVYKDKINPELEKNMDILFKKYDGKNVDTSGVDFIQEELQCCGIKNYTSWQNTTWYKTNHTVPISCCRKNATRCTGDLKELDKIYTKGCEAKVEDLLQRVLGVSMLIILGFVIIERPSAMIGLTVSPEVALADEPVKIQAWGLPPQESITLRAWLKDEKGEIFQSRAFYKTDDDGKVDLEHTPATGGDFHGVHPMGLFWALKPDTPFLRLLKRDVKGSPFYVHFELYRQLEIRSSPEEPPTVSKIVERWFTSPHVQRVQIREGRIRGVLFLPPGEGPFPGVIDMFGGVGGILEFRSGLLASHGFASLALAYFAYEDLPGFLGAMDLKYFEEAAQFLCNHPKVSGEGVGVIAICKGAEMGLAMATYLPQVAATVCINGTNAVNGNTLSYDDLFIPGIPYQTDRVLFTDRGSLNITRIMDDPRKPEHQDSVYPVERARGPILFLVGENDQNYDSLFFAKQALARARKYSKKDVYLRSYPKAGHLLEPPGSPFCPVSQSPFFPFPLTWGGELVPHCTAQEHSWKVTQDFLRKNIPCSRRSKL